MTGRRCRIALVLGFWVACGQKVFAEEVCVVLSSNFAPYQEAFAGFQEAFGRSIKPIVMSDGKPAIPSSCRVVVAFGGKAAVYPYAEDKALVYGLAPGLKIKRNHRQGRLVKSYAAPRAVAVVAKFKELQPGLRRLAVLWSSDSLQDYLAETNLVASLGVEMIPERLDGPGELPDRLRALKGKVDALWVPPDPVLITPQAIATIKEFSWSNDIPFYAPTDAFVEQGAVASVSSSFKELGHAAGEAARRALSGEFVAEAVYPETFHITINLTAARETGLQIPPQAVKSADKVLP